MGVTEIIMLVCGIAFLVLSFFVGNGSSSQKSEFKDTDLFSAEKVEEIKKSMEEELAEKADDLLEDTKNKLSSVSNETIISVDEFSKQTLERINHNHEEVVFMYNMLQNKEDELKKNVEEYKKIFDELEKKKEEIKNEIFVEIPPSASGIEMARKKSGTRQVEKNSAANEEESVNISRKNTKSGTRKNIVKESVPSFVPSPIAESQRSSVENSDSSEDNKNAKILELYQQKKSVLEISKALGLGQGEVKLVIDLYGKN